MDGVTMKTPINDGGPSFPCGPMGDSFVGEDGYTRHQYLGMPGMSLRAWLAGQALMGTIANPGDAILPASMAKYCVRCADAMIAELSKPPAETP